MMQLHQLEYDDFGRLRFLDFFPKTAAYREDHIGGLETGIGLACSEGYPFSVFTSLPDAPWQTVEIILELGEDCPEAEGHALLAQLGLPIRKGMSAEEVEQCLGTPEKLGTRWLRFVVGDSCPYYVGCLVTEHGLGRVWIARKDTVDENSD